MLINITSQNQWLHQLQVKFYIKQRVHTHQKCCAVEVHMRMRWKIQLVYIKRRKKKINIAAHEWETADSFCAAIPKMRANESCKCHQSRWKEAQTFWSLPPRLPLLRSAGSGTCQWRCRSHTAHNDPCHAGGCSPPIDIQRDEHHTHTVTWSWCTTRPILASETRYLTETSWKMWDHDEYKSQKVRPASQYDTRSFHF